jgi:hypothetical protein
MRNSFCLLLTMAILTSTCLAQTGDWAAVEGLAQGTDISIKTKQGRNYRGEVDSVAVNRLTLWSQEHDFPGRKLVRREIARADVKSVRPNHPWISIAAGAGIGAGIGIGIGSAVDAHYPNNEDRGLLGEVLGILGAAIGAGIAKSHPFIKGKAIYVAP